MRTSPAPTRYTLEYAGPKTPRHDRSARVQRVLEGITIVFVVLTLTGVLLPVFSGTTCKPYRSIHCQANLRMLGQCLLSYAQQHKGQFPPTLRDAFDDMARASRSGFPSDYVLNCPELWVNSNPPPTTAQAIQPNPTDGGTLSYAYQGRGLRLSAPAGTVLAHDRPGNHRVQTGVHVLLIDGSVRALDPPLAAKVLAELKNGQNPPPSLTGR